MSNSPASLSDSEKKMLLRMENQARHWGRFRWWYVFSAATPFLVGMGTIRHALHLNPSSNDSLSYFYLAFVIPGSWLLVATGILLLGYIAAHWNLSLIHI